MHLAVKFLHTFVLFLLTTQSSTSVDSISPNRPLKDGGNGLISSEEHFALGFFSPANSKNRYVGIWYNKVSEQTVVWVANRDTPIRDSSGVLSINTLGNLVLNTQNNNITVPVWSTNVSVGVAINNKHNVIAQILDTGNLVLVRNDANGEVLWQSFDHPTNTMLPFMKLGLDRRTGLNRFLTSWKSQDDPGTGTCAYRIYPDGFPQLFLHKGGAPRWRSGSWTGHRWSGVPEMTPNFIFNVSFVDDGDEITVMYGILNTSISSRMVIDESGIMERFTWNDHQRRWVGFWSAPKEPCDYYRRCGAYGICDPYHAADAFECRCFPGFEPKSPRDWYLRDGSDGCKRKRATSTCGNGEGFVKVARVKVPDTWMARANMSLSLKACEQECLKNCTCTAYAAAYDGGIGCVTWHGDLVDSRTFTEAGQDFYVRVDAVELAENSNKLFGSLGKKGGVSILVVASAVILFLLVFFVYWVVKRKRRERERYSVTSSALLEDSPSRKDDDGTRNSDLPLFDLSTIAAATDNFSTANKLGQGGFGSVYKGLLFNGKEIAVKRLSKYSGQGVEEFKNEVTLIAKLQHRNLVRILGCCVEEKEKMLIYEYLPNKSLDSFIFDEVKRSLIDWSKRFEIISGIARGMLYLHQDSRLRIIHRDLKASNVLLDAAMNPKISDFGMARICGGDQIEGSTNRVVGTYGYMSPEYAMEGKFSIKSDIYSFGVLLLEIIAGNKNSGYYPDSPNSNLIGHVWELWKEEKAGQIIDPLLGDSYPGEEVEKCIQIGLLCVQEHAMDRPTMSTVVFMLANDTALPSPKQPAFILKRNYNSGDPSTSSEGINSVNDVTVSIIEAR